MLNFKSLSIIVALGLTAVSLPSMAGNCPDASTVRGINLANMGVIRDDDGGKDVMSFGVLNTKAAQAWHAAVGVYPASMSTADVRTNAKNDIHQVTSLYQSGWSSELGGSACVYHTNKSNILVVLFHSSDVSVARRGLKG